MKEVERKGVVVWKGEGKRGRSLKSRDEAWGEKIKIKKLERGLGILHTRILGTYSVILCWSPPAPTLHSPFWFLPWGGARKNAEKGEKDGVLLGIRHWVAEERLSHMLCKWLACPYKVVGQQQQQFFITPLFSYASRKSPRDMNISTYFKYLNAPRASVLSILHLKYDVNRNTIKLSFF